MLKLLKLCFQKLGLVQYSSAVAAGEAGLWWDWLGFSFTSELSLYVEVGLLQLFLAYTDYGLS